MLHTLPLLLLLALRSRAQCPPLGPTLPIAGNLTTNPTVKTAISNITSLLDSFTSTLNSTAFVIKLGTPKETFLDFAHQPSVYNASGGKEVDGKTQFAVASVSKLFTALAIRILVEKGCVGLGRSVGEYVPELYGGQRRIDAGGTTEWSDITIEALLGHEGGIAVDLGDDDLSNAPGNYSALGLPVLNSTERGTGCGSSSAPTQKPCTWEDFFTNWPRKDPIYRSFTTPVYSNVGYALLGLVIERVTGRSFEEYLQTAILGPLGLKRTSVNRPFSLRETFITAQTGDGDLDLGFEASSGGIYSTPNDLYALMTSILTSTLLRPSTTRAWLKPRSFTSSSGTFVGEVWEIARGVNLTGRNDGHIVDVYTKGGNLNLYSSLVALVPDYNLVFVLTSAGPGTGEGVVQVILSQILETLIPAIERANKAAAEKNYAGTYAAGNDSITLAVDSGPGLLVTNFTVNGVADIISNIGQTLFGVGQTTLRLYPTNLISGNRRTWQGVYDVQGAEEEDSLLFFEQGSCQTWSEVSLCSYGFRGLDQFGLIQGEDGINVGVDAGAWRVVFRRG